VLLRSLQFALLTFGITFVTSFLVAGIIRIIGGLVQGKKPAAQSAAAGNKAEGGARQ